MSNSTDTSNSSGFEKYPYEPSLAAGILFIVLFTLTSALHLFQLIHKRTWFMIPFFLGGAFEIAGYIGRVIASEEAPGPYALGPYILQSITILVAPALLAASIYMELGRIVMMVKGEGKLFIRRTWLTKIFVGGDVASFLIQAAGAGMASSSSKDTADTGKTVIVIGLFSQIVFFGLFVLAAAIFHFRLTRTPTNESRTLPWTKHQFSLYAVSILIFIRSIVRVVEFLQGFEGYVYSHEWCLYVFDATMMFVAMGIMNVVHPGEVAGILKRQREESEGKGRDVESRGSPAPSV